MILVEVCSDFFPLLHAQCFFPHHILHTQGWEEYHGKRIIYIHEFPKFYDPVAIAIEFCNELRVVSGKHASS